MKRGLEIPEEVCRWFLSMQRAYDDVDFLRAFFPTTLWRYTNLRALANWRHRFA